MSNLFRSQSKIQDWWRRCVWAGSLIVLVHQINEYWLIIRTPPDIVSCKEYYETVVISERERAGYHGPVTEMFTEEYMARVYQQQIEITRNIDYIRGFSPWILYDFRSPRRQNRFQQGYNRKGLIAEDKRTRKLAFGVLQEYYRRRAAEGLSRSHD